MALAPEKGPEAEPVELFRLIEGIVALLEGMAELPELAAPVGIPDGAPDGRTLPSPPGEGAVEGLLETGQTGSDIGEAVKPAGNEGGPFRVVLIEKAAGEDGGDKGTPAIENAGAALGYLRSETEGTGALILDCWRSLVAPVL
ncbi:MAG: hypothetical protein R6V45_01885, partial [Oceanipulchritudo sp.]